MLTARKLLACGIAALLAMAAGLAGARELRVADTHPADYPIDQARVGALDLTRVNPVPLDDLIGLAFYDSGARSSYTTRRPIQVAIGLKTQVIDGARIIPVDKAAFAEAMRPVHERFATEPRLRDLVRRIQAVE